MSCSNQAGDAKFCCSTHEPEEADAIKTNQLRDVNHLVPAVTMRVSGTPDKGRLLRLSLRLQDVPVLLPDSQTCRY